MTRVLWFAWACLLALPAQADEALHQKVRDLLSGFDDPVEAQALRALGDGVGNELLLIARNPSESTAHRERATYALGWFATEAHRDYLARTLADAGSPAGQRRSAIWALTIGWGDAALPALEPAFLDTDVQLRAQVARALGRLGTPAARARLEQQLAVEPNAMVAHTLHTALGGK